MDIRHSALQGSPSTCMNAHAGRTDPSQSRLRTSVLAAAVLLASAIFASTPVAAVTYPASITLGCPDAGNGLKATWTWGGPAITRQTIEWRDAFPPPGGSYVFTFELGTAERSHTVDGFYRYNYAKLRIEYSGGFQTLQTDWRIPCDVDVPTLTVDAAANAGWHTTKLVSGIWAQDVGTWITKLETATTTSPYNPAYDPFAVSYYVRSTTVNDGDVSANEQWPIYAGASLQYVHVRVWDAAGHSTTQYDATTFSYDGTSPVLRVTDWLRDAQNLIYNLDDGDFHWTVDAEAFEAASPVTSQKVAVGQGDCATLLAAGTALPGAQRSQSYAGIANFGDHRFCLEATSANGLSSQTSWGFGIDTIPAAITQNFPTDGQPTQNGLEPIQVDYDDYDDGLDQFLTYTTVDVSKVEFSVDGMPLLAAQNAVCQLMEAISTPEILIYAEGAPTLPSPGGPGHRFEDPACPGLVIVTEVGLQYHPLAPWTPGDHTYAISIQDTAIGSDVVSGAWRFTAVA